MQRNVSTNMWLRYTDHLGCRPSRVARRHVGRRSAWRPRESTFSRQMLYTDPTRCRRRCGDNTFIQLAFEHACRHTKGRRIRPGIIVAANGRRVVAGGQAHQSGAHALPFLGRSKQPCFLFPSPFTVSRPQYLARLRLAPLVRYHDVHHARFCCRSFSPRRPWCHGRLFGQLDCVHSGKHKLVSRIRK